jgi:hypothetical protein
MSDALGVTAALATPGGIVRALTAMASGDPERVDALLPRPLADSASSSVDTVAQAIAFDRSVVASLWFGQSMQELLADAKSGRAQALFDAVRVFPGTVKFDEAARYIHVASLTGDQEFFSHLATALQTPIVGVAQYEVDLNHALEMLKRTGSLSRLNAAAARLVFMVIPALYPSSGEDPVGSLLRRVRRFKSSGRTLAPEELSSR